MKDQDSGALAFGIQLFLALVVVFLSSPSSLASREEIAAKVLQIKGSVKVLRGTQSSQLDAASKIFAGDTIQTESDGRVKLLLSEGNNEVVVGSSTRLLIERVGSVSQGQSGTTLSLKQGAVRSTVRRKYSGEGSDVFEVRTPNAVAGVRGTQFLVSYDRVSALSRVATMEGAVAVKAAAREILVSKGMFSSILGKNVTMPESLNSNPEVMKEIKTLSDDEKSDDQVRVETESPKDAEVSFDQEGNEVVVEKGASGALELDSRAPASTGLGGGQSNSPSQQPAVGGGRSSLAKKGDVQLPMQNMGLVNLAPSNVALPKMGNGLIPGLNTSNANNLKDLTQKSVNDVGAAELSIPIQ